MDPLGGNGVSHSWLASYPKSGKTWMRALLTNLISGEQDPASINALLAEAAPAFSRPAFDALNGLPSSDLTSEATLRCYPLFHELLAAECPGHTFATVHSACLRNPDGALLFPRAGMAGLIYIVRNPLTWPYRLHITIKCRPTASLPA